MNPRLVRLLFVWGPAVLVMAVLFAASSASDTTAVPAVLSDTILHLGGYAILGITVFRALADARCDRLTPGRAAGAVLFCILYGLSDEFHQSFVPGRTPDAMDVVMDALGSAIGAGMVWVTKKWLIANRQSTAKPH